MPSGFEPRVCQAPLRASGVNVDPGCLGTEFEFVGVQTRPAEESA